LTKNTSNQLEFTENHLIDSLILNLDASNYIGSGNWLDSSGNSNHATPVQTPTFYSNDGGYFDFNGGSITATGQVDSFSIQDSLSLDNFTELSIEFWLNITQIQSTSNGFSLITYNNMLFSKRSTYSNGILGLLSPFGLEFRVGTSNTYNIGYSGYLDTGVWQQIAITFGQSGSKIYKNGTIIVDRPEYIANFSNANTNAPLLIGDVNPNASGVFGYNGKMSIFRMYNKVLSESEVQQNFNAVKNRYGL
jgi:hypothetical protein